MTNKGFIVNWRSVAERRPRYSYPEFLSNGEGLCFSRGNPDDFTEDSTLASGYVARARAAAVCGDCPFSAECLVWAQGTSQTGVWGGIWFKEGVPMVQRVRKVVRNAA